MIVVDTSALVCIFRQEPDADAFRRIIARTEDRRLPASVIVEFTLLHRLGPMRTAWIAEVIAGFHMRIASITARTAELASAAALVYGRGAGHPAGLNFGDCLTYAVAKELSAPLLFKGDDFRRTDVRAAL